MHTGPKTQEPKTRLKKTNTSCALKMASWMLVSLFSMNVSNAQSCEDLLVYLKRQSSPTQKQKLGHGASQKKRKNTPAKTNAVTLEQLFTFESTAETMGFRSEKKQIVATTEEIAAILKLTNKNSESIIALSSEMAFYFSQIPLTSVTDALELAYLRNELDAKPENVAALYNAAYEISFRPQSQHVQPFPPNTDLGLVHNHVLGITALHLSQPTLNLKQTKLAMRYLENTFLGEKRLHLVQSLQVFLSMKIENHEISFHDFTQSIKNLQSKLIIEKEAIGFYGKQTIRPSLEEALMLKILALKAHYTDAEMITLVESVISMSAPESFVEVAGTIGQGLRELEVQKDSKPARIGDNEPRDFIN